MTNTHNNSDNNNVK